ncbi:MAG: prepilin-type N-terminal cleavage/methylation domain-containing protein [Clostridiales bacterium]|nr:prepilin-type N-terminal cleavage/methylation domain-containing protein [Clostridiales bacterium]
MKNLVKSGKNSNKGFTLVEVIISIGFLCVACGIIIQLFIASDEVRSKAALREIASLKAANAIEACKISDSPANVGEAIFNQASTNYKKTEAGYVINEYFNEDWGTPQQGTTPVYVLKVEITEVNRHYDIKDNFGENDSSSEIFISGLYKINVTTGYVDTGRDDSVLAEYSTLKYFVYRENGE